MSRVQNDWLPRFRQGQIVTDAELNRAISYPRDQFAAHAKRSVGWGVVQGLDASFEVASSRNTSPDILTIHPGFAIDGIGRELTVRRPIRIDLNNPPFTTERIKDKHRDIREVPGMSGHSVTPVLVHARESLPIPESNLGIELQGTRFRDGFDVRFVKGRVTVNKRNPLLDVRPVVLSAGWTGRWTGFDQQFQASRDALAKGLMETPIAADKIRLLSQAELSPARVEARLENTDCLTIALLNEAIYGAWQFARARTYRELREKREMSNYDQELLVNGVALGWLYQTDSGEWVWDSNWRTRFLAPVEEFLPTDYNPIDVETVALRRIARALERLERTDRHPEVRFISPRAYRAGNETWLADLGFDRRTRLAELWPLDPLRGDWDAPDYRCPRRPDQPHSREPSTITMSARPLPSPLDPVNDPWSGQGYADAQRIDPNGLGLVGLVQLTGQPRKIVEGALHDFYRSLGRTAQLHPGIHSDDLKKVRDWTPCAVAAIDADIAPVFGRDGTVVVFLTPAWRGSDPDTVAKAAMQSAITHKKSAAQALVTGELLVRPIGALLGALRRRGSKKGKKRKQ